MIATVLTKAGMRIRTHVSIIDANVAYTSFGTFAKDAAGVWRWICDHDFILHLP